MGVVKRLKGPGNGLDSLSGNSSLKAKYCGHLESDVHVFFSLNLRGAFGCLLVETIPKIRSEPTASVPIKEGWHGPPSRRDQRLECSLELRQFTQAA